MKEKRRHRILATIIVAIPVLVVSCCGFGYWATRVEEDAMEKEKQTLRAIVERKSMGEQGADGLAKELELHGFEATREGDVLTVRAPFNSVWYTFDLSADDVAGSLKFLKQDG